MVELSLRDRPAIVTGASRGIGREIAARFAEAGGDVAICSRSYDDVEPVAEELTAAHAGRVVPVECDVTDRDEIRNLVDTTIDEFGDIRVLVNNAGGSDESANTIHRCDEAAFEWMVDLNLKSQFLLSKEVLPAMVASGGGSMVHMGSVNGLFGIGLSGYSEAKSGLLSMSRNIAAHYGQHGIRSNVISAGTIETANRREEMESTEGRTGESSARDRWLDQYPLGRFGTPDEVADTTLFLASEMSSFITGENLVLDGGLTTSLPTSFINEIYQTDEIPARE
ncbi:SDR family oxidoreductase (plasmid) [Haloferax mediterranei ATCC 33500]|uniref:3-oxoacyl-ACP reductase n=1 Tax=Haloferax mediterranei (strain ATCC 33500 / DSM 1411 / JCM 8866 / NBRC 14739 / NCIMB 2177 / R-4) TaxID=523841 RepID=I3RAP9_HALMT|nr:SDR family NAD(P)-dependent oxidoreductase [Haloferax mediterranei]AFK21309.1 3-oxoacyl-[acyl-carrier protein] reductase [Haloferax mediterranei ATCC 33500]AHZ24597.1 3-oxoacyl-ACP reductase [Haloferax mediterranei ATCC 33500]ELZ97360.1 3-oxoacyl-ACP reductase [Haloferax mediterranei ATCC 33500]MDX5990344.1 SDR family NAD(P)-dependent oxidoreductase [Haloferax mediterranei ATCC 33500]QCQ76994.1 SDR family oxidoreductase [Haloferax mediterranei ATCC 33500]